VAARAEAAPATGKRDQYLVPALWAPHPGEPLFEIPTLQKPGDRRGDDRSPETIPLLVTLLVNRLKLRKEALDQFVKWRLLRAARTIDAAGLLGTTGHTNLLGEGGYAARPTRGKPGHRTPSARRCISTWFQLPWRYWNTVTCTLMNRPVAEEWLAWLRDEHFAEVCAAGALDAEAIRFGARTASSHSTAAAGRSRSFPSRSSRRCSRRIFWAPALTRCGGRSGPRFWPTCCCASGWGNRGGFEFENVVQSVRCRSSTPAPERAIPAERCAKAGEGDLKC
jgi:hypothetical protein